MPLLLVILVVLMPLLWGCASKHFPPAPVDGIDIIYLNKGQVAPFNGVEMSPFYLNEYLQWKSK